MVATRADENWLTGNAWERIDPVWRDRMLIILEDLAGLGGLRYAFLLLADGKRLSKLIGPGGPVTRPEGMLPAGRFSELAAGVRETWEALKLETPTHILEDFEGQLVFTGMVADFVLVASFEPGVSRGAVVMRLTKRIRHLRTLEKSRKRGALYV
jgi:hypothetical protein